MKHKTPRSKKALHAPPQENIWNRRTGKEKISFLLFKINIFYQAHKFLHQEMLNLIRFLRWTTNKIISRGQEFFLRLSNLPFITGHANILKEANKYICYIVRCPFGPHYKGSIRYLCENYFVWFSYSIKFLISFLLL